MTHAIPTAIRTTVFAALLALLALAAAQHPLAGEFLEQEIGFLVSFQELPGGQLGGAIIGQDGPIPLTLQANQQMAQGLFMLGGERYGFSAQLEPDGRTLTVYLYGLDAAGAPVPGSYERYTALRQQAVPPQPPAFPATQPVTPFPAAQPGAAFPTTQPGMTFPVAQPASPIVGTWQGTLQQPGLTLVAVITHREDGTYRDDVYVDGQMIAFYEGTYTLSQSGTIEHRLTNKSPQICIQGRCTANDVPSAVTSQIAFQGPDTMTVTTASAPNQPPVTVTYRRANPGAPLLAPSGGVMPGGYPGGYTGGFPGTAPGGYAGGYGGYTGGYEGGYPGGNTGGDSGTADFIQRGIWNEWDYTNPSTGATYSLPYAPDPNYTYTSPSGNTLRYDDTGTWYEVDNYGYETPLDTAP